MKQAKNDWLDCIQCEAAEVKVFRHRQQWSGGQVNRRAAIIINNIGGRLSVWHSRSVSTPVTSQDKDASYH